MGSSGARIAAVVAALAAVVVLFVVLSGGDDDASTTSTTTGTEAATPPGPSGGGQDAPGPGQESSIPTIVVEGGQPVDGVQELDFKSGENIRFKVSSDEAAEIHFHGYDIAMDVDAGGTVSFDVPADIEGVFEVEVEETATQIAEIKVEP